MKLGNKAKIGIVFVLALLVFSALTLLYWDFVRDTIIVPIYYFIWIGNLTLKSIPQQAFLALLVIIGVLVGLNTLIGVGVKPTTKGFTDAPSQADSRYTSWKKLCSNLYSSSMARDNFAWEARKLIIAILAHQDGIEPAEVEERIKNETLLIPLAIKDLIQYKKIKDPPPLPQERESIIVRLRRLLLKEKSQNKPRIDSPIAEIVAFIEHQLEINHVTNQPES
ncbi:MAG: hypothetical protein ABI970_00970 [Chloroflexota bacterium]